MQCSYSGDAIQRATGETCRQGCRDLREKKGSMRIDINCHSLRSTLLAQVDSLFLAVNPLAVGKSLLGRSIRCASGCNDQPDNNILQLTLPSVFILCCTWTFHWNQPNKSGPTAFLVASYQSPVHAVNELTAKINGLLRYDNELRHRLHRWRHCMVSETTARCPCCDRGA